MRLRLTYRDHSLRGKPKTWCLYDPYSIVLVLVIGAREATNAIKTLRVSTMTLPLLHKNFLGMSVLLYRNENPLTADYMKTFCIPFQNHFTAPALSS